MDARTRRPLRLVRRRDHRGGAHGAVGRARWRRLAARPPGLVFYVAGADPHEGDRLGRLKLSTPGLAARDEIVLGALAERGIPAVVLMAGGYGHVVDTTVDVHLQTLRIAARA